MRSLAIIPQILVIFLASCAKEDDFVVQPENAAETQTQTQKFAWVQTKHVETREQFRRNFGLGYSYDAVRGEYCNWRDIRCQVFNKYFVEDLQTASEEQLLNVNIGRTLTHTSQFEYSLRDYVANVGVETTEEIDLGIYNGEKHKRSYFIEDGVQETIFYTLDEKDILVDCYLSYASLLSRSKQKQDIFTESFRNAVMHLNETDDNNIAAVDSFLNVWGTHVIVAATLGGKIRIDLKNYSWRYNDKSQTEEWSAQEFLGAVQNKNEHRTGEDEFTWIEDSKLNISAWGGDQSTLTNILGEHNADGTRNFSTDGIAQWRNSLYYDPADELSSNVELIDMDVIPIWQCVEAIDKWQALRVKAAVLQDAALQQQLLGNVNFFDATFPIRYPSASCKYQKSTGEWATIARQDTDDNPQIVNIVSGGRYVATVCHEVINGKNLWACYPIYEGAINMSVGVGVDDDNNAYRIRWTADKCILTDMKQTADGYFYITGGSAGVKKYENASYAESHAMPYIEICGGVQPDGGYDSQAFVVSKRQQKFVIATSEKLSGLVGFTASDDGYARNDNYTYIYNPNEIKYE